MSNEVLTLEEVRDAMTNVKVLNEVVESEALETVNEDANGDTKTTLAGYDDLVKTRLEQQLVTYGGMTPTGPYQPETSPGVGGFDYTVNDLFEEDGVTYLVTFDFTSTTFEADETLNVFTIQQGLTRRNGVQKISSVFDTAAFASLQEGDVVDLTSYHNGWAVMAPFIGPEGGGRAIVGTAVHNGGSVISLTRARPTVWGDNSEGAMDAWFLNTGVPELCIIRPVSNEVNGSIYGLRGNFNSDDTITAQAAIDSHSIVNLSSGIFYFNDLNVPLSTEVKGTINLTVVRPSSGATLAVDAQQDSYVDGRLRVKDIIFDGSTNTSATGLKAGNITGLELSSLTIQNFSMGTGLLLQNSNSGWTENSFTHNVRMTNNLVNISFDKGDTGTDSFGYTFFNNVFINLAVGQTGIQLLNGARIYNATFQGITFAYTGGGTGIDMAGGTINDQLVFDVREEGTGGVFITGGEIFEQSKFSKTYANGKYILWRTAEGGSANVLGVDASNNVILSSTTGLDRIIFSGSGSSMDVQVNAINWTNRAGTSLARSLLGPTPVNDAPTANTALQLARDAVTNRSISASGTVNASGADYAEYEYNNGLVIKKGDIVGFKADGTLTNVYSESIRFAVKSTDPALVGGDRLNTKHDRENVDRIAYSGKVPVNLTGGVSGQYLIAVSGENGEISGQFIDVPTFDEYLKCVGRVNKILNDGRCEIAVIIH